VYFQNGLKAALKSEKNVRPKEVLKNMRPVDMTPEEREEVEKEAEEVWTWITSLAIVAGIMFLIRSLVTFISRRSSQRS
jgi:uncharacterized membrane-anchored protein